MTGDTDIDEVTDDLNHPLFLSFTPGVVEVAANKNSRTEFTTTHNNNYSTSKYTSIQLFGRLTTKIEYYTASKEFVELSSTVVCEDLA